MKRSLLAGVASLGLVAASAWAQAYESHTPGYGQPADTPGATTTTVETRTDPYSGVTVERRTVTRTAPVSDWDPEPLGPPGWADRPLPAEVAAADSDADRRLSGDREANRLEQKPAMRHRSKPRDLPPDPPPGY